MTTYFYDDLFYSVLRFEYEYSIVQANTCRLNSKTEYMYTIYIYMYITGSYLTH